MDFFAGSTCNPPVRVDGPPFDTAAATGPAPRSYQATSTIAKLPLVNCL